MRPTTEMPVCLGIDFGTSTSSVAWMDDDGRIEILKNAEGEERTPSIVYYGEGIVLVGKFAADYLEDEEEMARVVTSIKRDIASDRIYAMPGRRVRPVDIATDIFKKLKHDAEELQFHQQIDRAVVTVPAAFDTRMRDKIKSAAEAAGFCSVELLEEPVAAAMACLKEGLNLGNRVLVYDLGGGTFDLAVLERDNGSFQVALPPRGMARCGGDDFDRTLYDFCETRTKLRGGTKFCETGYSLSVLSRMRNTKERLSQAERVTVREYTNNNQMFQMPVTRADFEQQIDLVIGSTVASTLDLIKDAEAENKKPDSIILIGGSSRIPLIQSKLAEVVSIPILRTQHQDVAVAMGAAIMAAPPITVKTFAPEVQKAVDIARKIENDAKNMALKAKLVQEKASTFVLNAQIASEKGQAKALAAKGNVISAHFSGLCDEKYSNGLRYIGEGNVPYKTILFGKKVNYGILYIKDGTEYRGEFFDGDIQCLGELLFVDGEKYLGQFLNFSRNGLGKYVYDNDSYYIGHFSNNKFDGLGVLSERNCNYEGELSSDKKDGLGVFTLQNGEKYKGEFSNNKYNGYGVVYLQDESILIGFFKNNLMHNYGAKIDHKGNILEQGYYENGILKKALAP